MTVLKYGQLPRCDWLKGRRTGTAAPAICALHSKELKESRSRAKVGPSRAASAKPFTMTRRGHTELSASKANASKGLQETSHSLQGPTRPLTWVVKIA